MNKAELEQYFLSHNYPRYEREHWDAFVAAIGFHLSVPTIHGLSLSRTQPVLTLKVF